MIKLIESLSLKKNDVVLFEVDKNEKTRNIHGIICDLSRELKFRIFGIVVPKGITMKVLSKERKIKLKQMLEESLKED